MGYFQCHVLIIYETIFPNVGLGVLTLVTPTFFKTSSGTKLPLPLMQLTSLLISSPFS